MNYRITATNYSHWGSRWSGITLYDGKTLIFRLKTGINGTRLYLRKHPGSKHWETLKNNLTTEQFTFMKASV